MNAASASYAEGSVFAIRIVGDAPERRFELRPGRSDVAPNDASFDLAVIQFEDDGTCLDSRQIDAAEDCTRKARAFNENSAVVVVFIHGWHHGARWARTPSILASELDGDDHFHSLRLVLESLALREAEPNPKELGRAGGVRIWEVTSWGWGPRTGRPRCRRALMWAAEAVPKLCPTRAHS